MAALPLACHSTLTPSFYGVPGFICKVSSCRTPYSCPSRLSFHSQQWFPPWIFTPNPIFQHPVPLCNRRHMIQARMSRAVAQTMHEAVSLAFHRPSSALIPWRPISVPADSPTVMGFSPPSSASCQSCWSLFWFLFSVLLFSFCLIMSGYFLSF